MTLGEVMQAASAFTIVQGAGDDGTRQRRQRHDMRSLVFGPRRRDGPGRTINPISDPFNFNDLLPSL
jgi:hypothetical protein